MSTSKKRSCPGCGQPVVDDKASFCPKCESLEISRRNLTETDFQRLSEMVAKNLESSWQFKAKVAGIVIAVVLAVIGIVDVVIGFNFNERLTQRFEAQERKAVARMDHYFDELGNDVKSNVANVDLQMRSNIVRNFESPVIQALIHDVAKQEAKSILEEEVAPAVERFRADATFIRTIARAHAYDFKAFQLLAKFAAETNDNSELAGQVVTEIERSIESQLIVPRRRFVLVDSGTNFDSGPFSSDELAVQFSAASTDRFSFNREAFVNSVADLKQPLFLPRLVELLTNETDVGVANNAINAISALAGKNFRLRDYPAVETWWKYNCRVLTNWPFDFFEKGQERFRLADYQEGVKAFEKVLAMDPGADVSRAHAIVCYSQVGETNRAKELSAGFKYPSRPWARWAKAEADLMMGDVSNATVQFYIMSTNRAPTYQLDRFSHIYRTVDWQLFDRLKGTNAP